MHACMHAYVCMSTMMQRSESEIECDSHSYTRTDEAHWRRYPAPSLAQCPLRVSCSTHHSSWNVAPEGAVTPSPIMTTLHDAQYVFPPSRRCMKSARSAAVRPLLSLLFDAALVGEAAGL
jgi:hypothetical protein